MRLLRRASPCSARYLVRPLAAVIGWPIERIFGTPGRLARENAERNPGRTATTAAALMVGVGLVVFVAVFAAGLKSSISGQIDELVRADMVVYGEGFQPISIAHRGRDRDRSTGVEAAVPTPYEQVEVNGAASSSHLRPGDRGRPVASSPRSMRSTGSKATIRSCAGLGPDEALIEEQFAEAHHLEVGDRYRSSPRSSGGRRP